MFSKACEYAIKATIFIAKESMQNRRSNLQKIAKGINSPVAFTAKILQQLARNSIIVSSKGANGGFEIDTKSLKKLTLGSIVFAIDGDGVLHNCVLGLTHCSDVNPCPVHDKYKIIKNNTLNMLEGTFIKDLATGLGQKIGVLKN